MNRVFTYILSAFLLVIGSSCITNKSTTYLQESDKLPQYEKAEYSYYKIQKNDQLVFRVLSLSEEAAEIFNQGNTGGATSSSPSYRVYEDGTIDIPFVNNVPVLGLTIREAAKVIENYIKPFVPDAMVKLALANDKFYVVGDGGGTGEYELYKEKLNIFQALALVGDVKRNADRKRITIIRNNPDAGQRPILKQFDLRTVSIIDSEYYYIQPNDVIYVGSIKGNFIKVEDFSSTLGTISTSINFLLNVINLGLGAAGW